MDKAYLKRASTVAKVIFGNVFYALVIKLFLLPGNLMTGGTTGIGLVVKHFTGASISGFVLACLLYTSPSPRDPKTSRMPSSA